MFVVALMSGGELVKTVIRNNANDAVETAQEWYGEEKERRPKESYIAIDQKVQDKKENVRFAELRFDRTSNEIRLFNYGSKEPVFKSKVAQVTKHFLVTFLEQAIVQLADYVRDKKKH